MKPQSEKHNNILVITYVFPPAAYVGVYRTLKYCRYLGAHGWIPLVLTINSSGVFHKDQMLCRQIPDYVKVYRTVDIDPAKWLIKLSRWKNRLPSASNPMRGLVNGPSQQNATSILGKLKACLITLLTKSPDSHIFWVPFAIFRGIGILLRQNVDVIYSTSPPHSSHIIAFILAKLFRKPYVLDFRDPWVVSGPQQRQMGCFLNGLARLESFSKSLIIRNAAKVITVSEGERNEIAADYPEISPQRFAFITNGFDSSDFSSLEFTRIPSQRFTITHVGTIYGGSAGEFFDALELLLEQHPGIEKSMRVQLIGDIAAEYVQPIHVLESRGLVKTLGLQPHATALRMMMESDLLVILWGGDKFLPSDVPAKTFEYLYAEKPILAVAKKGDLAEILENSGSGMVVLPGSAKVVAKALWGLYSDYTAGRVSCSPNRPYIQSFERTSLTEKLAEILNEVREMKSEHP